ELSLVLLVEYSIVFVDFVYRVMNLEGLFLNAVTLKVLGQFSFALVGIVMELTEQNLQNALAAWSARGGGKVDSSGVGGAFG
ncbi:hypothetical protein, partial [Stenotrophomonas sp. SG1]|uniref:hypothetical protein n=1 Tax=Stenotrophomonas sp. SG1 TaxID=2944932 RepID=UPI0022442DD5